jgi:hypothetical protein
MQDVTFTVGPLMCSLAIFMWVLTVMREVLPRERPLCVREGGGERERE